MVTACPKVWGWPFLRGSCIPLWQPTSFCWAAGETAKDISAVVFDKTGTLTEGRFGVTDILPLAEADENRILALAASLEGRAEHPIAQAVTKKAEERGLAILTTQEFRLIPGEGIEGQVGGRNLRIVSPGYLKELKTDFRDERLERLLGQAKTV
jgi:Cu2+-exporting ATPase